MPPLWRALRHAQGLDAGGHQGESQRTDQAGGVRNCNRARADRVGPGRLVGDEAGAQGEANADRLGIVFRPDAGGGVTPEARDSRRRIYVAPTDASVAAPSASIPVARKVEYLPMDLSSAASVVTTRGMFYDPNGPRGEIERLVFSDWSPKTFEGIPFQLIDPVMDTVPNAIMLHSKLGTTPPKMPRVVTLPCDSPATRSTF